MYRILTLILVFLTPFCLPAQVNLPWSINTPGLPADSTLIDPYTTYIDTSDLFLQSGYHAGDIVPDFTLYDTASQAITLSALLSEGKPLVLVSVSYTCPASRSSMAQVLPTLVAMYGSQVNFLLVYTMEAHPLFPDLCPYTGTVNTMMQNYQDSVLYPQAKKYFHRKTMAAAFINRYHPGVPVLIDGTGNEFWNNFGPAPNNAYLITATGMVFAKYGWFSRSEIQLLQDIPILLSSVGVNEQNAAPAVSLYPNPASGNTIIQTGETKAWSYRVYDLSGKPVLSMENIATPNAELSAAELPAGMYLVEIATSEKRYQFRLVRN